MSAKQFLVTACFLGGLGVAIGAFGAHALPNWLTSRGLSDELISRRLGNLETGVRYHMYHSLALFGLGLWQLQRPASTSALAGYFILAGILFFSGGLYALVLTEIKAFAMVVPIGGVSWIIGWATLGYGILRTKS